MRKTTHPIRNTKHFVLMWFVLFAFSPCVVKDALFSTVNIAYTQPLNKSKTTSPADACQSMQRAASQVSVPQRLNITKGSESATGHRDVVVRPVYENLGHTNAYTGNAPPKYILYKRLRLDVV